MLPEPTQRAIVEIPLDLIEVLNPRGRNAKKFEEIVTSIDEIGLKKPITLAERQRPQGQVYYVTGCGEGRIKAYRELGYETIPAFVVDLPDEELLLISLVENLARRHSSPLERLSEILDLKERGEFPQVLWALVSGRLR